MSSFSLPETSSRTILPATVVIASIAVLAVSVTAGFSLRIAAGAVVLVTLVAWVRPVYIGWHRLLAGLILVILFIPIRRYTLPGNLPFQLEPYRLLVVVLLVGWGASLLVDRRTRLARTGFEGPLLVIFAGIVGSIVTNPGRVEQMSSAVQNDLIFFLSFVLMLYLTVSVVRRLDTVDYLVMTLVAGGAVVAFFAIVEARTGFNVFNHLDRVVPVLQPGRRRQTRGISEVWRGEATRVRPRAAPNRAERSIRDVDSAGVVSRATLPATSLVAVRDSPRRRLRIDGLPHRDHDVRRRRRRVPVAPPPRGQEALAGADPRTDRRQARPARDARCDQTVVPARRRARRRAGVQAGRIRQWPNRRPRACAAGVEAEAASG